MKNILEYFEETEKRFPDKVGFTDSNNKVTFHQAMEKSKRIASELEGFGFRKPVAILIDKNCKCINAMLASLYAGDFYIVVDVHSPTDRIVNILSTLEDAVILTDRENYQLAETVKTNEPIVLYEDAEKTEVKDDRIYEIKKQTVDRDTAYILFTSGSTGKPKGTVISHRALISYVDWVTEEFGFDEKTSFGSQTPLYFSMSVTDFYSTIKCGCCYNIIPKKNFAFPINLINYLNEQKINTIYWVPTAISILANWKAFEVAKLEYLDTILFAGEVMPTKQLNYWIKHFPNAKFANLFGPTETTDICTFYVADREFGDSDSLPIGRHCDNCDVFIVNDNGERVKDGEEGELYVRSSFLADGYYNNPEKTSEAFVQNPLNKLYPEKVYKTGDIVKYNEKGELIYISRKDFQIKRSGYRIELGEIEAGANSVDGVKSCACVYDKEEDSLILIYEGRVKDSNIVLEGVKKKVPPYMYPDKFLKIREMPKNANGKINRKYLTNKYKEL